MKKAFTLIELLVVVAIMGLLGTASVGGYRQMQRGMEERRVVDNASKFLALAAERAQIERQPVVVYYWNEMLRGADNEDENEIIVGRAVAVRPCGRMTRVLSDCLIDEFGDFEQYDGSGNYEDGEDQDTDEDTRAERLYQLDNPQSNTKRYTLVSRKRMIRTTLEAYPISNATMENGGLSAEEGANGVLLQFGYVKNSKQDMNVNWKVGNVYGREFQTIELPHGYLFGNQVPTSIGQPESEWEVRAFLPTANGNVPSGQIQIYAMRQGAGGNLERKSIGTAKSDD